MREELGDSYSPFSFVQVGDGGTPNAETYISNTTAPELLDEVVAAVTAQLDDLRAVGPTEAEFAAASENIRQQLDLFSNEQINDEVLSVFTDPAGNASFDEFLGQAQWVDVIDAAEIRDACHGGSPPIATSKSASSPADPRSPPFALHFR